MKFNPPCRLAGLFALVFATPGFAAESYLLTGPQSAPQFINSVVGTDTLWGAGYYGSGVVIANVEAGHVWSAHEVFDRSALGLPANPVRFVSAPVTVDAPELGEVDFHATMVGHVLVGAGLIVNPDNTVSLSTLGAGMAPLATLWSGAIATHFDKTVAGAGSFDTSAESFRVPYVEFFTGGSQGRADVINSSWGYADGTASVTETRIITGLAAANPSVTAVFSAGNSGPGVNKVGGPGSSFNVIAVGSVGGAQQLTPSSFSSGGWSSFYDPVNDVVIPNARAAVHVSAPGENLALAAYLQPTGGLEPLLNEAGINNPANDLYFVFSQSGTSFASPIVAGGVGLLKNLARSGPYGLPQTEALDTRVMRSVVMASSIRTEGWNNAQVAGPGGALITTQALDLFAGAGRFDVGRAAVVLVGGTADIPGLGGGTGLAPTGWDYAAVHIGQVNDYVLDLTGVSGAHELTVSLNWLVDDHVNAATGDVTFGSFANLDLELWSVSVSGTFVEMLGASRTTYNNTEFMRLAFTPEGKLGLRVRFDGVIYDFDGLQGGEVGYGLAWAAAAIPEPAAGAFWMGATFGLVIIFVRGRRRSPGA